MRPAGTEPPETISIIPEFMGRTRQGKLLGDVAESKPEFVEHVTEATQGPPRGDVAEARRAFEIRSQGREAQRGEQRLQYERRKNEAHRRKLDRHGLVDQPQRGSVGSTPPLQCLGGEPLAGRVVEWRSVLAASKASAYCTRRPARAVAFDEQRGTFPARARRRAAAFLR